MRQTHHRLLGGVLVASLALFLSGTVLQAATAAPVKWLVVPLGTHRFGHLSVPAAIVAQAARSEVGWSGREEHGCGCNVSYGPSSFDVARDGSIWLLDEVNNRLLAWQPGQPDRPARIVRLPFLQGISDFILGSDGTIYLTYEGGHVPGEGFAMSVAALTPTGQLRWKAPTIIDFFNAPLHLGPDGALYGQRGTDWVPVTSPAGRPLPLAEQRRRISPDQPLPGGLRLVTTYLPRHEMRYALMNSAGRVERAWSVTSQTELSEAPATPVLIGGDLAVALNVTQQTKTKFLYERLVLRLAQGGGASAIVALDPHVVRGDTALAPTVLRVASDGQLYQLRSSPDTGVSIARYSLDPTQVATQARAVRPSGEPSVAQPTVTGPVVAAPASRSAPASSAPVSRWIVPGLAGLGALLALSMGLVYRRRHTAALSQQDQPR